MVEQPGKITSFDAADPGVYGDVLNIAKRRKERFKVGFLGVGYFEYWRMYPSLRATVQADLERIRRKLARYLDVVWPGMVDTLDRAEEAGRAFSDADVDVVVIVEGTYLPDFIVLHALEHVPGAPVVLFNTQNGADVSSDDNYEATMRNSALIGMTQLSGTFAKARRTYDVVVGEASEDAGYEKILGIVRAREAVSRLRMFTIGLVGHVFRGMFDLEFDRGLVRGGLGPEVVTIQAEHLVDIWKTIPKADVSAKAAAYTSRFRTRSIGRTDIERSVRLGLAMRGLAKQYRLDALCFLGQHYLEKITGAPARLGASMLMEDDHFLTTCEGDVGGLIMMEAMRLLTGRLPVQLEWGQFDTKHNALFLLGHGIGDPSLAAGPEAITLTRSPEEWGFEGHGANWEMILGPGPVTLGHFLATPNGWQMFLSEGESLAFPCLPCDEIHALVRVAIPVREYLAEVLRLGVTHHLILVHGNIRKELELMANVLGLEKTIVT